MRLFDIDGGLFRTLSRISDLIILNLLFLVTAIPVVTIGVNLTAVCSITNKMVRNEESYIWRSYWKSWKQNFRQGLIIWLVFLAFGAFLLADCFLASRMGNGGFPLKVIFTLLFVFWIMGLSYVFPILSRFDNSTKNIIRNAILMSIRHLPWTIMLLLTQALPVLLLIILPGIAGALFTFLLILVGVSGTALMCSYIFVNKIFPYYYREEN